jgi:hypothetical protein
MYDLPGKVVRTARHGPRADRRGNNTLMLHARPQPENAHCVTDNGQQSSFQRNTEERKGMGVGSPSNKQRRRKRGEAVPRGY